jgi:glycosyltransferase involved in cell wall biosynthesis
MVSIIIPCYNSKDTIIACVTSAYNQSYQNIEIIIVDDGSTDNSIDLLNKYVQNVARKDIIHITTQKNQGPSSARNNGIKMATGNLIAFLDSDDYWHPEKLAVQIDLFESNKDISLISCIYNNNTKRNDGETSVIPFSQLLKRNYFAATSTVIVRREALQGLTFNEKQKHSEDYRLWLQIAYKNKCAVLNKPLAYSISQKLEYGDSGLSANLWKMEEGELKNYTFIYREGYINIVQFIQCILFSFIKYLRRLLIIAFKKI